MAESFMGFSGFYGDRYYAFKSSAARKGFPYLNASIQQQMLLYRPQFRHADRAALPPNVAEAASISPGVMPANGDPDDLILDVLTPSGSVVAIDDPALMTMLGEGIPAAHQLTLVRSDRSLTDCRPISLISLQTVRQLENELNLPLDKRRFRANIYLDLDLDQGFVEDELANRKVRIGSQAVLAILERDPRCKVLSLDPDTGEHQPQVLKKIAQAHDACAGVYGAVLIEGIVRKGDSIELLD